jgi:hypothetical protein
MSFYTSSIKTEEIQANSHTSQRTEFKLGNVDMVYLTNFRLCNVGAWLANADQPINHQAGIYSMISRMELLDGDITLDLLDNFNYWAGFRQYNKSNDKNMSEAGVLSKNSLGYIAHMVGVNTRPIGPLKTPPNWAITEAAATINSSWLSLKDFIAVLDEMDYLPTKTFNNLRLVIEWETDVDLLSPDTGSTISGVLRPYLLVDTISNPDLKQQMEKNFKGGLYRPIESTRVYSPAITANSSETYTLTSYNNKTVNRIIMQKGPTNPQSPFFGKVGSATFGVAKNAGVITQNPEYQLVVSGSNLLPGNGYTSEAQCLAALTDSWGDCTKFWLNGAVGNTTPNNIIENELNVSGWQSYVNFDVNQFVKQMQLKFTRPYPGAYVYYTQALNIRVFAEVNKSIIVNPDGSYIVRYI